MVYWFTRRTLPLSLLPLFAWDSPRAVWSRRACFCVRVLPECQNVTYSSDVFSCVECAEQQCSQEDQKSNVDLILVAACNYFNLRIIKKA